MVSPAGKIGACRPEPLQPGATGGVPVRDVDITLLVLSGLVLWKSVQFPLLRELLFGYEGARRVHFFSMVLLIAFVAVHLVMVALVPKTLLAMIAGRKERV